MRGFIEYHLAFSSHIRYASFIIIMNIIIIITMILIICHLEYPYPTSMHKKQSLEL